jgi:TolB-like protein/Tfp pilus assembly protein PilF
MISGTVYDHLKGKLTLPLDYAGEQRVKNISRPVRTYVVRNAGAHRGWVWRIRLFGHWLLPAAALVVVLLATGFGIWWSQPIETATGKPSIVVLPFDSLSDNAEQDYFADGLTDDLITDLSKISGLTVIAHDSAFAFKNQPKDVRRVARQLGTRYVLEGNVRRAGDNIRINVQLVDGATASNVWAERYEGSDTKLFELQDQLIKRVVEALSVRLTASETAEIARLPTRNLEAYDFYTRAEQKVYSIGSQSLGDALALYEKAISIDPGFAEAYAGHARAIADVLSFDAQTVMLSAVARQRAYESASRALELNPKIPRAYAVLGILQMLDGEMDRAIDSVQQAVALDPNAADAKLNLAIVLTFAGRNPEALTAIEQVLQLDPKPKTQVYDYYALVLYMNRRYEEALRALRSAGPDRLGDVGLETLAMANARLGRMEDAHGAVEAILKRNPSQSVASLRVVYGHHTLVCRSGVIISMDALKIDWTLQQSAPLF